MKPGETVHIGDGAYLHFDGYGFELRANHHEHPTDRVYIDRSSVLAMQRLIHETIYESRESNSKLQIEHD